ncbi:hypothetical protein F0562_002639 [Nyssa sinensis]|uniref:Uncharacterized protein n=1 Tax=Nyssa sinensis TaxID=561372 RepID=A0A5J5BYB1_9ASTE|nr:hypothetical protein F0562_002639 [Nyssa sinensis]
MRLGGEELPLPKEVLTAVKEVTRFCLEREDFITLHDLKGCRLFGNVFNILFYLNKFMAFETRDPFLIRQCKILRLKLLIPLKERKYYKSPIRESKSPTGESQKAKEGPQGTLSSNIPGLHKFLSTSVSLIFLLTAHFNSNNLGDTLRNTTTGPSPLIEDSVVSFQPEMVYGRRSQGPS